MSIAKRFQDILKQNNPVLMGIVNLSADSFCTEGRCPDIQAAFQHALQLWQEGAQIIDLGAEPTNPFNHQAKTATEQIDLLVPLIKILAQETDALISVDTSHPEVIRAVAEAGAHMINDVRALRVEGAIEALSQTELLVCLMHLKYLNVDLKPPVLESNSNIVEEILGFLKERIAFCFSHGIAKDRILIDPGLGGGIFGKTCTDNLTILKHLDVLQEIKCPILIGASRKQFIGEILQCEESDRLIGSVITQVLAARRGAHILRVHDVKATRQALKMYHALEFSNISANLI